MPELSIVITAYNCLPLTQACLKSLEETIGTRSDFEVIIADDASVDGTSEWVKSLPAPRYQAIRHESRRGFGCTGNSGVQIARGTTLVLLNNDTVLLPNWLEAMLGVLERAPQAGIVGNIQREADSGLIHHAGMLLSREGDAFHVGMDSVSPPDEEYLEWPAVTGACFAMRRELFLRLGGFDEQYLNSYEDVDLCLKVRAAGFRNYVANRSVIYHHVTPTPNRNEHDERNFSLFRKRWGEMITGRAASLRREEMDALQLRQLHEHRRRDGWRYLRKHVGQPWRYNAARVWQAIAGAISRPPPVAAQKTEPFFWA